MKHSILVAERSALEQLIHEAAYGQGFESAPLAMRVHISLEILLAVLEYEDKLRLCVDDVVEAYDVRVLELFHERYLADGSRGRSFLCIEVDLLQSDDLIGASGSTLYVTAGQLNSVTEGSD